MESCEKMQSDVSVADCLSRRFRQQPVEYAGTDVYHTVCLPTGWTPQKRWPVIVEYAGNFYPESGCTGEIDDVRMGFGLSEGRDFILVAMPFISKDHKKNEPIWWGDEKATVDYVKTNLPAICEKYSGDTDAIFICGFSRGAIAVNYFGLYDDEIAKLWRGFITHDHYDGVIKWDGTQWGYDLGIYRENAKKRLSRIKDRPVLVMQNPNTDNIKTYLYTSGYHENFTFLDVHMKEIFREIPNEFVINAHNDNWLLFDNEYSRFARKWLKNR